LTIFGGLGEGGGVTEKITFIGGVMEKNLITGGGVIQLFNDTSKNPTSPHYLVKNERSLIGNLVTRVIVVSDQTRT